MIVDDRRPVGDWLSEQFGWREVFVAASKTKLVGEICVNIVWSGDRSPINRRSVADQSSVVAHHFFWLVTIRRLQKNTLPSAEQRQLLQ